MASDHAEPDPQDRSEHRHREGEQPQRPCEAPQEELQRDVRGVLRHEDQKQAAADQRGDDAPAEPASARRRTGATGAGGVGTLLDHDDLRSPEADEAAGLVPPYRRADARRQRRDWRWQRTPCSSTRPPVIAFKLPAEDPVPEYVRVVHASSSMLLARPQITNTSSERTVKAQNG